MRARLVALLLAVSLSASAELDRFPTPPNPLSPASLHDLAQLEALSTLGNIRWEWHPGDLAHGEDPAQIDNRWKSVDRSERVGVDGVWMRAMFRLPSEWQGYDLTGASLFVSFQMLQSGTTPAILYLNSHRIAMGADLEPELIAAPIKPGQTVALALKLLETSEAKTLRPGVLAIRFAADRPDPVRFRDECLSAAMLLPTIDKDPVTLAADVALLERAIGTVDFAALHAGRQLAFDTSLRRGEAALEPLRPKLATLHLDAVGNSHIDAAWKWPWTESLEAVKSTFTTALQLLPEYPDYRYVQPDMQYDDWLEHNSPGLFSSIRDAAKAGRWQIVGGMWAEPDLNEPDGETMTRELLIGQRYLKRVFGQTAKIGWNVDSFGYSWQLPQVYKKSGIDFFVTQKINWNETNRLPLKLFWWQSPDGSSVLTYFPQSYYGTTDPVEMAREFANARPVAPGLDTVMHLFGVGDHGGGPTRVQLDEAERWSTTRPIYPTLTLSTPEQFFAGVDSRVTTAAQSPIWNYHTFAAGTTSSSLKPPTGDGISIPVWRDELYLETHRGTYTTQAKQKKNMRDSEEWLLDAEKLSAIAWATAGVAYPQAGLNDAWKKVLFNTNHDLAAGSGIASIYRDAQADYDAVHAETESDTTRALDWMIAHANTSVSNPGRAVPIVITNTLAWPRDGVVTVQVQLPDSNAKGVRVRDAEGHPVASQVLDVDRSTGTYRLLLKVDHAPALGFTVLEAEAGDSTYASDLKVTGTTMENALLRVDIDPKTGCLTHLVDKSTGFDSIADQGCGNQLQTFVDKPKKYDAWNIDMGTLDRMVPVTAIDSVQEIEHGPLRASIRVKSHWGQSTFQQTIMLYAGTAQVDVENHIDWRETQVLLKAAVPLRASSASAAFEIPYGVIERPTTRNNSVEKAMFEVPALRWADLGDSTHGLALINNSKYGYDATAHLLRLTLLKSPIYPDPDADRGPQDCTYALVPHAGTWKAALVERRGYEFNYTLQAQQAAAHEGSLGRTHSFLEANDDNVILTSVKKSEDGHALVLRVFDWSGKDSDAAIRLPGSPLSATEADMLEQPEGQALVLRQNVVYARMHPYEIKTIRVEYPEPTAGMKATASLYGAPQ